MAKFEIEKKWSFPSMVPSVNTDIASFKEDHLIEQWYLVATDNAQVRVSHRHEKHGSRYTLNIKNGNGLVRKEVVIDLTYKEFLSLIAQCDKIEPIIKHLYVYILPDGSLLEISEVDNKWWYAEVEFKDEEQANKFNISEYFHCPVKDETENPEFMMKNYWRMSRLGEDI